MRAASATIFGPATLRTSGARSSILDLWYAQLLPDQNGPICLVRRMLPPYSQAPEYVGMLEARLREVHRFAHASILVPRYWQLNEGSPYLLLEAPTGCNLQDVIKEALERQVSIPVDLALQWLYPVAHALASAHARPQKPLVHGAIRPGSIWLEQDGRPRLGDFEVGALAEFELRGNTDFDLNGWRCPAPERSNSWDSPPPAVDVYSMAAVLLEVLCVGRTTEVQYQSGVQDRLAVLHARHLPLPLLKLLARAHADDPATRPSMGEFMEGVKEVGRQLSSSTSAESFLTQLSPFRSDLAGQVQAGALDAYIRQQPAKGFQPEKTAHALPVMEVEQKPPQSGKRGLLLLLLALGVLAGVGVLVKEPLQALLSPKPPAMLELTSEPSNAVVTTRAGTPIGFTPLSLPVTVGGGGELELNVAHTGYESQALTLTVDAGGRLVGHVELKRSAQAAPPSTSHAPSASTRPASKRSGEREGGLVVTASAPAQLDINGNPFGDTTNAGRIKLSPGRHTVELRQLTGDGRAQYQVLIQAGQVVSLHYEFGEQRWRMGERPANAPAETSTGVSEEPSSTEVQGGSPSDSGAEPAAVPTQD